MIIRNLRVLFRFSYPYAVDLRDVVDVLSGLGYSVRAELQAVPPGSTVLGSVTAVKGDVAVIFDTLSGSIAFFVKSVEGVRAVTDELDEITKRIYLGRVVLVEISLEALMNGELRAGDGVVGIEIVKGKRHMKVTPYYALKGSYVVLVNYKLEDLREIDEALSDLGKGLEELNAMGLS